MSSNLFSELKNVGSNKDFEIIFGKGNHCIIRSKKDDTDISIKKFIKYGDLGLSLGSGITMADNNSEKYASSINDFYEKLVIKNNEDGKFYKVSLINKIHPDTVKSVITGTCTAPGFIEIVNAALHNKEIDMKTQNHLIKVIADVAEKHINDQKISQYELSDLHDEINQRDIIGEKISIDYFDEKLFDGIISLEQITKK